MLNISEYMGREHEQLDALWLCFLESIEKNETSANAKKLFQAFKKALSLHIKLEDEVLFPRLYLSLGLEKDSTIAKQSSKEHAGMLKLLALCEDAFNQKEKTKILNAGNNLGRALKKHHARENKIQYPVSDKFIPSAEWARILAQLR